MRQPLALLAAAALAAAVTPALAQSAGTVIGGPVGGTDVVGILAQGLLPTIAEIVVTVVFVLFGWLAMVVKKRTGIDMEAGLRAIEGAHRDALHSAVETAFGAALAKWGPHLDITPGTPAANFIISFVRNSVPEAVTALGATDQWIVDKAQSELGVQVVAPAAAAVATDKAEAAAPSAGLNIAAPAAAKPISRGL